MAIINEENARIAKQLSSFSDYVEGSATASPGIYIPRPANLKTRIPTGTSKCTSLWRYLHETQGNPHS